MASVERKAQAMPTAVIAGSSGFVGTALRDVLQADGYSIRLIGRRGADAAWGDKDAIVRAIDGADMLINLAGKSVNCRYTDANRDEVFRSRVETTRELHEAVAAAPNPPALWMNASTATIYRYAMDRAQAESTGELGSGFSVDVARNWENEFFKGDLPGVRRVALRMAIVLGDGPATNILFTLARFGLGGPQFDGRWFQHRRYRGIGPSPSGDGKAPMYKSQGRQRFSWIHIDDVIGAMRFIRDNPAIEGPVNLAAPEASDNRTLMASLRSAVKAPFGLPAWRFMVEPAMWAIRTEPELIFKSRWVVPETLMRAGYRFRFTELARALEDVVRGRTTPST